MRFILNGVTHDLTADQVVERLLRDVHPARLELHGVRVAGRVFPTKQAFEVAIGRPRSEFTSHIARRHLSALGFEVIGDIQPRADAPTATTSAASGESAPRHARATGADESWHTEAAVQAALVGHLVREGWQIVAAANTATREQGIDVEARRGDETLAIEVKGFPSRAYADPARAAEKKPKQPSTQAGHYYAQAVVAAMRARTRRPKARSVIALPDFPRYRHLYADTTISLQASGIEVWWLSPDGDVEAG